MSFVIRYSLTNKINKEQNNLRLDLALTKLSSFTRSQIKIFLLSGNIKKNEKIIKEASYHVKIGEKYSIKISLNFI